MDKEGIIVGCGIPFSSRLYFAAAAASIPTDGGASDDLSASEKRTTDAMRRKTEQARDGAARRRPVVWGKRKWHCSSKRSWLLANPSSSQSEAISYCDAVIPIYVASVD